MNEQNRPNVTVIYQDAKSQLPGAVEVILTIVGAITVLMFVLGGCHL